MTWLEIYALLTPVLILVVALILVVLTRWQDEREARRRGEKGATTHRP